MADRPIPAAGSLKGFGLRRPATGGEAPGLGRDAFLIHIGPS
jgi:hypothetical protein